jgi:hypothetical protein
MYRLRHAMDHCKSDFFVEVLYLAYNDNCQDDLASMLRLSNELGFEFKISYAYFMNIDKLLAYTEGSPRFNDDDKKILNRMIIPLDEALAISQLAKSPSCMLQTNHMVINYDGSVALCCSVYDPAHFIAQNYLEWTDEQLQQRKQTSSLCGRCMSKGLHDYACYKPFQLWDAFALDNQIKGDQPLLVRMFFQPMLMERSMLDAAKQ